MPTCIDNVIEYQTVRDEGGHLYNEIQTLDVKELATEFAISFDTLRKQTD